MAVENRTVTQPRRAPKRQPWHPVDWAPPDAAALKALERGDAEPEQQKRALAWILSATQIRDEVFVPDNARVTDYLLGRRSIGLQIAALLKWVPRRDRGEEQNGG